MTKNIEELVALLAKCPPNQEAPAEVVEYLFKVGREEYPDLDWENITSFDAAAKLMNINLDPSYGMGSLTELASLEYQRNSAGIKTLSALFPETEFAA